MRRYSQISVQVPEEILDFFLAKVCDYVSEKWRRDTEAEATANAVLPGLVPVCCYFVARARPHIDVIFQYQHGEFKLAQVVLDRDERLTLTGHGRLILDLWNSGMKRACEDLGLRGQYTPPSTYPAEEGLPPGVADALHRFAVSVNKSTGSTHPDDLEKWCRFLALLHASGETMDEERMDDYLRAHRFPEKIIIQLLKERMVAEELLRVYDRVLQSKTAASVQ